MRYISTRGDNTPKSFTDVLLSGLAPDGGLYLPEHWPQLNMDALRGKSYAAVAEAVIGPYIDFPVDDLRKILTDTYGETGESGVFNSPDIAPLRKIDDNLWLMELFHGPTLAFKDVALQLLGRLFDYALNKSGKRMTILGATSGDTGSAAIEACKGRPNIDVYILHPHNRTSDVQRRQMTSVFADNIHNIAVEGNFDDCQAIVKQAFADHDLRTRLNLSAINSINWARIIGQTVYYVYAVLKLQEQGIENPAFAVPTGNFGNIFAGLVAKKMGAPIGDLIIGSNRNDILTRFFETGEMRLENVEPSLSPSMDIQISSNFERYLFELSGRNGDLITEMMHDFKTTGNFTLDDGLLTKAREMFQANRVSDQETLTGIRQFNRAYGIQIDPHTSVGLMAAEKSGALARGPVVSLACAHPSKFPDAVERACGVRVNLPLSLAGLLDLPERYKILPNDYDSIKNHILKV